MFSVVLQRLPQSSPPSPCFFLVLSEWDTGDDGRSRVQAPHTKATSYGGKSGPHAADADAGATASSKCVRGNADPVVSDDKVDRGLPENSDIST